MSRIGGVRSRSVVDGPGRVVDEPASALGVDVGFGDQVLDRLEAADRHTELDPSGGVFDGQLHRALHQPDGVRREHHHRGALPLEERVVGERRAEIAEVDHRGRVARADLAGQVERSSRVADADGDEAMIGADHQRCTSTRGVPCEGAFVAIELRDSRQARVEPDRDAELAGDDPGDEICRRAGGGEQSAG